MSRLNFTRKEGCHTLLIEKEEGRKEMGGGRIR